MRFPPNSAGIIEECVICKLQMPAVVGNVEGREAPQATCEVVLGIRVVDGPPRAKASTRVAGGVHHACHVEFGFGRLIAFRSKRRCHQAQGREDHCNRVVDVLPPPAIVTGGVKREL